MCVRAHACAGAHACACHACVQASGHVRAARLLAQLVERLGDVWILVGGVLEPALLELNLEEGEGKEGCCEKDLRGNDEGVVREGRKGRCV